MCVSEVVRVCVCICMTLCVCGGGEMVIYNIHDNLAFSSLQS